MSGNTICNKQRKILTLKLVGYKDCSSKFRSKHSTNTVLCLLRNLLEESLIQIGKHNWDFNPIGKVRKSFD